MRERCLRVTIFMRNMRQCSKKYLTSDWLSTIYNEHMIKINGEGDMIMIAGSMENNLDREVHWVAPDSGGYGR